MFLRVKKITSYSRKIVPSRFNPKDLLSKLQILQIIKIYFHPLVTNLMLLRVSRKINKQRQTFKSVGKFNLFKLVYRFLLTSKTLQPQTQRENLKLQVRQV